MNTATVPVLTSVGIDIGTTTTQVIVSQLTLSTSGLGAVSVDVQDSTIVYRGTIHETPLVDQTTLDVPKIQSIVESELAAAGYQQATIDSGAVIVTGESSYKSNAEELVQLIAEDSGDFVVATAGPALEAVLAGNGSGAASWATTRQQTVLNVDIGGGTTNMCLFAGSDTVETRCLDIGGRLLRFDQSGQVTHLSEPAIGLIAAYDLDIEVGMRPELTALTRLADVMAEILIDAIRGEVQTPAAQSLLIDDGEYTALEIDTVMFSGGVGRLVTNDGGATADRFTFDDFGVVLAAAIRETLTDESLPVEPPNEDIRATVIGAGTQTTSFSGTTISVDESLLPLKNLPVIETPPIESDRNAEALTKAIHRSLERGCELYDTDDTVPLALSIPSIDPLSFSRITTLAQALSQAFDARFAADTPRIILTHPNCAKALAQRLTSVSDSTAPLVVIDELAAKDGDYLDIGTPIVNGRSVPVVIKSLVFD